MSHTVPQVDEGGQEPVDEHQPVLRTRTNRSSTGAAEQFGIPPGLPDRPQLGNEIRDHRL